MEGVEGNEALYTVGTVFFVSLILIWVNNKRFEEEIYYDAESVFRPRMYNTNCPICWSLPGLALGTSCGHLYCGPCLMSFYYRHQNVGTNGINCPMCRQKVEMILKCFLQGDELVLGRSADLAKEIIKFADRYNRKITNTMNLSDWIDDLKTKISHFWQEILAGVHYPRVLKINVVFIVFSFIMYLAGKYELFSNSVFLIFLKLEIGIEFCFSVYYVKVLYNILFEQF